MSKTKCFIHDCGARNSIKILKLRNRHGITGYGVYFMLLERLAEESTCELPRDYESLGLEFNVDSSIVKSVIEDFFLFVYSNDEQRFYSERLSEQKSKKEAISKKRSMSGSVGASSRWRMANAIPEMANATEKMANATEKMANATEKMANAIPEMANAINDDKKAEFEKKKKNQKENNNNNNLHSNECVDTIKVSTKRTRTAKTIVSQAQLIFKDFVKDRFNTDYYWQAKDGRAMKILLNQIKFSRENKEPPLCVDDTSLLDALREFLKFAIKDNWLSENFDVCQISSFYNRMIQKRSQGNNKLKNFKNNENNDRKQREALSSVSSKEEFAAEKAQY